MGQVLHGCATTTHAVRTGIQRSKAPLKEPAARHGLNHRDNDASMGPKTPHSTVLSSKEEAIIVAFRKHTLLPLDDCLYALQATISHLTRSSLIDALNATRSAVCRRWPVTRSLKTLQALSDRLLPPRHCRGSH